MKGILRVLYRVISKNEIKTRKALEGKKAFVVLGFQRSGTSLLCNMLNEAGVSFGNPSDLMAPDSRNPNGFFEHKKLFKLCRKFLKESNQQLDYSFGFQKQFKAQGFFNKVSRFFTRISIMKTLVSISSNKKIFGLKSFPIFWYFTKPYLGDRFIFAIYRNPLSVVTSFESAWPVGRYTASQVVYYWTRAHEDLLFHLSGEKEYVLISYEDLVDSSKRENVIKTISEKTGLDESKLKSIFDEKLNRSGGRAERLGKMYPLPVETDRVLESLEKLKI